MSSSPWSLWRALRSQPQVRTALRCLYWSPTLIFLTNIFDIKVVNGRSMSPTLNPDWSLHRDVVILDRTVAWNPRSLNRGDIVMLKSPLDPNYKLIKRIIAVEGDVVNTLPPHPRKQVVISEGHVWIEGDDHYNSDDSNIYGPVPLGLIESRLNGILYPFDRYGAIKPPEIPEVRAGPAFRRAMAAFEREKTRQERVLRCATHGPKPHP
ncbi:peptidase S24/S26A/S26B/S26C [Coprinopsis sp. MPI-PUGE-AT-0042]|nr:peptidase S24/S26A/S26B/S26C [Coprinopsis sp. MPI-PUGE-AT-0042]